jgi:hypothetical protein
MDEEKLDNERELCPQLSCHHSSLDPSLLLLSSISVKDGTRDGRRAQLERAGPTEDCSSARPVGLVFSILSWYLRSSVSPVGLVFSILSWYRRSSVRPVGLVFSILSWYLRSSSHRSSSSSCCQWLRLMKESIQRIPFRPTSNRLDFVDFRGPSGIVIVLAWFIRSRRKKLHQKVQSRPSHKKNQAVWSQSASRPIPESLYMTYERYLIM